MALPEGVVLELGQRVQFVNPLVRVRDPRKVGRYMERAWVPNTQDRTVREGIVVGKRTLGNGEAWWEDGYMSLDFPERFLAYLIVENMHSNPRRAVPEHITLLPTEPAQPATPPEGSMF